MNKKNLHYLIFITLFILPIVCDAEREGSGFLDEIGLWDTISGIFLYVLTAIAFMKIAKKTNTEPAWLAWIPIANIYLLSKIAREHWWPMLSLAVGISAIIIGIVTEIDEIAMVGFLSLIFFGLVFLTWEWKMFVRMGYPGWFILSRFIPIVNLYASTFLLMIVAWKGNPESKTTESNKDPDNRKIDSEEQFIESETE